MPLLHCDASHLPAIRAILNHEIATGTAIWEEQPRGEAWFADWLTERRERGWPVLGVTHETTGELLGYGTYGGFRPLPGYRHTVEHSLYVAEAARRQGVGRALLGALVEHAQSVGLHAMVAVIDATNAASRRLHESHGFALEGTLREVGQKHGRWLDACFYVRRLK